MADDRDRTWVDAASVAYERWMVPMLFAPYATDLAERVVQRSPARVLEVAAGTGAVTRVLTSVLSAEVVATDLNEAMVTVGRKQVPGASWRTADAMQLPFEDATFDVVVCQFGAMFFPDKRAAFAEIRRVLTPGGAFIANVWTGIEDNDFAAALVDSLREVFPDDPPTFVTDLPHGYHDRAGLVADLEAAGFGRVELVTVTMPSLAASAADVAAGFCQGSPLRLQIEGRGDLDATTAAVAAAMEERLGRGPVTGSMAAHVFEAIAL